MLMRTICSYSYETNRSPIPTPRCMKKEDHGGAVFLGADRSRQGLGDRHSFWVSSNVGERHAEVGDQWGIMVDFPLEGVWGATSASDPSRQGGENGVVRWSRFWAALNASGVEVRCSSQLSLGERLNHPSTWSGVNATITGGGVEVMWPSLGLTTAGSLSLAGEEQPLSSLLFFCGASD